MKKASKYSESFPSILRQLMENNCVKQEDLAKELNVTRQCISQYMLGDTTPDIEKFLKIVQFFKDKKGIDYTTDYWLGNSGIKGINDKDVIHYSDKCIQNLKLYQKDACTMYAVEQLINNEKFIKTFENYVINNNINVIFSKSEALKKCYMLNTIGNHNVDYELHDYSKYAFAEFLEILPLMKEEICKDLLSNNDMIFAIIAKTRKKYLKYNDKLSEDVKITYHIADINNKTLPEKNATEKNKKNEEYNKLLNDYNNYILRTNGDKNLLLK